MSDSETAPAHNDKPMDVKPLQTFGLSLAPEEDPAPGNEDANAEATTEETTSEADDNAGSSEGNEGSEEAGEGDAGDTSGEGADDAAGTDADSDDADGDGDGGDGGSEEAGEAGDGDGDAGTSDSDEPSRRVRPDKRTRAEIAWNNERAERASKESELYRNEAERWKARFEKLAADSVEGEELAKQAAEEEKAAAEKAKAETSISGHVPTQDDRGWLRTQAEFFADVSREEAQQFVDTLVENAPVVVTALRQLDNPIQMVEDLAELQKGKPDVYAWVVGGTPAEVGRKLARLEEDLQRPAPKAKAEEKPKPKPKPKSKAKKDVKPPPDKPLDAKTTPSKKAGDAASGRPDAFGVSWKDETEIEKKSWPQHWMA